MSNYHCQVRDGIDCYRGPGLDTEADQLVLMWYETANIDAVLAALEAAYEAGFSDGCAEPSTSDAPCASDH